MIGLSSILLQKTWNTFTLSNIYSLMHNNKFAADFFLKTCNFHCSRKSKNWEFQIVQIIDFLKTTKMIPECQDLLRLLVCASWWCISVSFPFRDIAITTFWIYIPFFPLFHPHPLKKMYHWKYAENLIFQSRFSCWFWELVELSMALKCSLRSSLSFYSLV